MSAGVAARHWLAAFALGCLAVAPAAAKDLGGARATAPEAVPELPASDLLLRYEGPELSFRWSLAPEAALEPALVRQLRAQAIVARERAIRTARDAQTSSGRTPPLQYEWQQSWQETAETDQLLAFSAQEYSFTGGAHGNIALTAVIWDRGADRAIAFAELFTEPRAMYATLQPAFCKALDDARRQRRDGQLGDSFADCPDLAGYPVTLVGDGRISGIRILVPPYEAGPWVEGVYEIDLDSTLVQPFLSERYRLAFTAN